MTHPDVILGPSQPCINHLFLATSANVSCLLYCRSVLLGHTGHNKIYIYIGHTSHTCNRGYIVTQVMQVTSTDHADHTLIQVIVSFVAETSRPRKCSSIQNTNGLLFCVLMPGVAIINYENMHQSTNGMTTEQRNEHQSTVTFSTVRLPTPLRRALLTVKTEGDEISL